MLNQVAKRKEKQLSKRRGRGMNIPTIGGARGIFEIFVPGMFLLVNLGVVVYLFPFVDEETKRLIAAGASDPVIALLVTIGFGYLVGMLLRLFRPDLPDKLSGAWVRGFRRRGRQGKRELGLWAHEDFPYFGWIEEVCRDCLHSDEALEFYKKTWGRIHEVREKKGLSSPFFGFCKVMVSCADAKSAGEVYAAEALTRYLSGMFYALVFASAMILGTVILQYVVDREAMVGLIIVLCFYLFAIGTILGRFRSIRTGEVEIVFAACFKNKHLFEGKPTGEGEPTREAGWLARLLAPWRSRR
jgi:hypothetical protein